jgi:hypothetical protein
MREEAKTLPSEILEETKDAPGSLQEEIAQAYRANQMIPWLRANGPQELFAKVDAVPAPPAGAIAQKSIQDPLVWEVLQDHAASMGPMGSEIRQGFDRIVLNEFVAGLAFWTVFATVTFKREGVTVAGASRAFERFCQKWLRRIPVIYYVEPNPTRDDGGHHVHALLACGDLSRKSLWEVWFKKHGVCRFEPIGNIGGVAGYCAKMAPYVTKSHHKGGLWWNILHCRSSWQQEVERRRKERNAA